MKFLYPEFLWALLLISIPIIIHLFNFKRYKTLFFSSLSFIKHIDQQTKSTQKLKHLLVLASRILAFTFLILAFAQPYFSNNDEKKKAKTNLACIYIDNSYSMQSRGTNGELLSEAREKVKDLVSSASIDTRFLIVTNEMSGREERILNKMEAFEKLDNVNYSPLSRSINDVIAWQKDKIDKKQAEENVTYSAKNYLFSDFQKSTTPQLIQDKVYSGEFYPVQLIAEELDNIYVDSVWFNSPNHKLNEKNELNFRIINTSNEKLENVELNITIDNYRKTLFVDIPAKGSKNSMITYIDKTDGIKKGTISAVDKHVFFDDAFYFSYTVQNSSNVLLINGKDQIPNFGIIYSLDNFYKTKEQEVTAITREDFNGRDLIVLNGVNDLSTGLQTYLEEFISTGGTIALFPGTNPNTSDWNNFLSKVELPVIGKTVGSGTKIKRLEYEDPFFNGMFQQQAQNLNLPSVSKSYQAIKSKSRSNDLITLQNGLPLLSYAESEGLSFMFYSSIHPDFGKFSTDALFSSILLRLGETSKRMTPLYLEIGNDANYPIYQEINSEEALHIKNAEFDFIPQQNEISGVTYLALNKLDNLSDLNAGNYEISNSEKYGAVSLNFNRIESNLALMNAAEITKLFGDNEETTVKYNQISTDSNFSSLDIDKPFPYWKVCIVLTLIFVATEMLLVRLIK